MTTQLRTIPTTALPSATPRRKEPKDAEDQFADQFAAVFSALSSMPMLQPKSAGLANSRDEAAAKSLTTPEIGEREISPSPPTPIMASQMLETVPETKAPNIEAEASWLPLVKSDLAPPGWQPPIMTPLSQQKDSVSPSPAISAQPPQAISSAPVLVLSPPVTQLAAIPKAGDPLQSEIVPATGEIRTQPVVAPKIVQDLRVIVDHNVAQQTLQSEAARREANLSAGQLAITTRYNREQSGVAGARTLLAGNGFDLEGGERQHDSEFGSQANLLPDILGPASFAAAVHDFEGNAGANSVLSQTVHQVLAMTESVNARQTRSLRLRLRPETLGQIEIELSRDASGRISAHISAERESARAALSQSLDQLREMLSRAGLSVDKLQIRAGPGLLAGNRESADARPDSGGSTPGIASTASRNETTAIGALRADDQKFLSLRA